MRQLAAVLAGLTLVLPASAAAATWTGTWENASVATRGWAKLVETRAGTTLQVDGLAFGCAEPVTIPVRVAGGRVSGSGRNLICNRGLRWTVAGPVAAPAIRLRLADGTSAELRLSLRRRG